MGLACRAPVPTSEAPPVGIEKRWIPADADAVVVYNDKRTLEAPLVKAYAGDQLKQALTQNDQVAKVLQAAGLDPTKDVETVMATFSGLSENTKPLIVVRGKFNAAKLHTAAEEFAKKNPTEVKFNGEGKARVYEITDKDGTLFANVPDDKTILVGRTKEYLLAAMKQPADAKLNKDLQAALDKVKTTNESMWLAVSITDDLRKSLAGNDQTKEFAPKLDGVTGSLDVTKEVNLSLLVHTTDAASAEKLGKFIDTFGKVVLALGAGNVDDSVKPYVQLVIANLKIGSKDKAATIGFKLTEDELKKAATDAPKDK